MAGPDVTAFTLASFPMALSPPAAAAKAGVPLSMEALVEKLATLPEADWRICEGAGGIATPLDGQGRDWADFAVAIRAEAVMIVVADRLGAINQGRLAHAKGGAPGLAGRRVA